jgi:hypothetical protein
MSAYYFGRTPDDVLGPSPQYFYALRRNMDGELFLVRSDQLIDKASYDINTPGAPSGNFDDFEAGIDFFDGIDDEHEELFANLKYPQYRWDSRAAFYYIDEEGVFVQRLFSGYEYPEGVSSNG